ILFGQRRTFSAPNPRWHGCAGPDSRRCLMRANSSNLAAPTTIRLRGLTVEDVAQRYRVSGDKVRRWIATGEISAVNTASALCGPPRWIVTQEALAAFERRRAGGPPPKPPRRRRRTAAIDFYPD